GPAGPARPGGGGRRRAGRADRPGRLPGAGPAAGRRTGGPGMTGRPSSPVRVLVVDDQPLIRHSLRLVVGGAADLAVVGEAAGGREAVERALDLRPDVALMDIRMADGDGIEATRQIAGRPELSGTRVLVLSMFELDEYVHAALRAGASGLLLKDAEPDRLVDAVRRTHAGESLVPPRILPRLVEPYLHLDPAR